MLNEESKFRNLILKLKQLSEPTKEILIEQITYPLENIKNVFNRKNIINATLPKPFALGVNKLLDLMAEKRELKIQQTNNVEDLSKETYEQVEQVGPKREKSSKNLEELEELEETEENDFLENLLEVIEENFDEVNDYLNKILEVLGINNEKNSQSLVIPLEKKNNIISFSKDLKKDNNIEIVEIEQKSLETFKENNEVLEDLLEINKTSVKTLETFKENNEVLEDLLEINKTSVKTLEKIEKNVKVDSLKQREEELESNKRKKISEKISEKLKELKEDKKENLLNIISKNIFENALGFFGLKLLTKKMGGKLLGGIKKLPSKISTILNSSSTSKISEKFLDSIKNVSILDPIFSSKNDLKTTPTLSTKVKKALGSFISESRLSSPFTIASSLYESFNIFNNKNLSSEEKTVEFSKLGAQTIGALGGVKIGASLGAFAGPLGMAMGGVLGGLTGHFLGEKGGEKLGQVINSIFSPTTTTDMSSNDKLNISPNSLEMVENVLKPNINTVSPSQTKVNLLQGLTYEIERVNNEKEEIKTTPTVIPIPINKQQNNVQTNFMETSLNRRLNIPYVRNQDGTIQRLLDINLIPLLRT